MAFWGTEVKPGIPFTLAPANARLHLSQATLGTGSVFVKSIVQCNVGNKASVYLCCLVPNGAECCPLNLEFEESDEVVFSVIGSRTVHLTGYYLRSSSLDHHNDESGEDIGDRDLERSGNSEESEYGGSFVADDDDPQVFPFSPDSSARSGYNHLTYENLFYFCHLNTCPNLLVFKPRRLRKKYQISESETDHSSHKKDLTIAVSAVQVLDSEIEDKLPISFLSCGKHTSNSVKANVDEKVSKETGNLKENETVENAIMVEGTNAAIGVQPESESGIMNEERQKHVLGVEDALMPKKKREELPNEERFLEADHDMIEKLESEQNGENQKLSWNVNPMMSCWLLLSWVLKMEQS
ncbi:hypothetical protein REPUB_Repub03eG0162900 [Reevesia pubescens]